MHSGREVSLKNHYNAIYRHRPLVVDAYELGIKYGLLSLCPCLEQDFSTQGRTVLRIRNLLLLNLVEPLHYVSAIQHMSVTQEHD